MGRTAQKLKPFITDSLRKDYINFRRREDDLLELYTPRYKKDMDSKFEAIFKEYEKQSGRVYESYVKNKDTLKSAIRRSKFYEVISHVKNRFVFRERSLLEIESMGKRKKGRALDASPCSSGYGSGEASPSVPSPYFLTPSPGQPDHQNFPPPMEEEIFPVDSLSVNMEDMMSLEVRENEFTKLKEDVLSDGMIVDVFDYLCDADQYSNNIGEYSGRSEGTDAGDDKHLCDVEQSVENVGQDYSGPVADQMVTFMVLPYMTADGQTLFILAPVKN